MTEAELNKERTLAYTAGYNAAKAEQPVGLTEEERDVLLSVARILSLQDYRVNADIILTLLARDAAAKAAGMVCVRREVLQRLMDFIDDTCAISDEGEALLAEAEAALAAKGGE